MAVDANLSVILQQLEAEKSIDRNVLIEAIRSAMESAARKCFHPKAEITVEVDAGNLTFKVYEIREVVEVVDPDSHEIGLEEAQALNPDVEVGNRLKLAAEPKDFGRIAAQTAKQVIIQKIKDAERDNIFDEFKQREGELITGVVKRISHGNIIVSVGKAEAVIPHREQSPRENFKPGDRIRGYLREVEKAPRGPQVVLSRSCPELVRSLFDLEVPEIYDGTVEIKALAREAGGRTKIAVKSNEPNVDPVGACVGMRGSRVRAVVEELSGEKIDIVRWSEDPVEFCGEALNPADILNITVDEDTGVIQVVVPHDQLSLAIGKRGQNARLASRLMGWNIDIKSDTELAGGAEDADGAESTPAEADESAPEAETPPVEGGDSGETDAPVEEAPPEAAAEETTPESDDEGEDAADNTSKDSGDPA
jgi:transcription termination/antitermination protein NusA